MAAPSVKQRLATLRHLFDRLVNGQVVPVNLAYTVLRLPRTFGARLPADVIVTDSQRAAVVAHEATRTIPIVGATLGPDPVMAGLAASLAHPGGNVTGFSGFGVELSRMPSAGEP